MIKSCVTLTMIRTKDSKVLCTFTGRKSKVIRNYLVYSIQQKDVLKADVLDIVWNTMQFQNIWDFFKSKNKQDKEDEQNGEL